MAAMAVPSRRPETSINVARVATRSVNRSMERIDVTAPETAANGSLQERRKPQGGARELREANLPDGMDIIALTGRDSDGNTTAVSAIVSVGHRSHISSCEPTEVR